MSCEKKAFPSRAKAKQFAAANRKRNGQQRPYPCHDDPAHRRGGLWHLTSTNTANTEWWREYHARKDHKKKRRQRPYDNGSIEA